MTLSEDNQRDILAYIMLFIFILVALYFTTSCKTIEYLPGDTITNTEYKVKIEKEIVRFDSIVTKTDTFDNIVFRDRTVYQTNTKTKIDTIYSDKETIKVNPINEQLKSENYSLVLKLAIFKKIALGFGIALLLIGLFWWIKRKLKFVF